MAQRIVKTKTNLGPGFWPITALIVVLSIIMTYFVYVSEWPIGLIPAGYPAESADSLFKFLGAVGSWIFNAVVIYTIYFAIVFRKPPGAPANTIGVQIHDAPVLEFWWTAIPTILIVILAIFSVKVWADMQNTQGDVMTIEAIGYQFGFQYRYPKLSQPVSELHLPVNVPVTVHVTSRDVIHGFWLPEFRQKADMVPGLINTFRIVPAKVGKYRVVCSEFCGIAHGAMAGSLFVDSKADFDKWFAAQGGAGGGTAALPPGKGTAAATAAGAGAGSAEAGEKVFEAKCKACHSTGGFDQKQVGPGLGKIFSDPAHPKLVNGADPTPQNVAKLIHDGYKGDIGVMPDASTNGLSVSDIANVTAYLASLSKK